MIPYGILLARNGTKGFEDGLGLANFLSFCGTTVLYIKNKYGREKH